MTTYVRRDPFARGELRRDCHAEAGQRCRWCGQRRRRLYSYTWESDARALCPFELSDKRFCNLGCADAYGAL